MTALDMRQRNTQPIASTSHAVALHLPPVRLPLRPEARDQLAISCGDLVLRDVRSVSRFQELVAIALRVSY